MVSQQSLSSQSPARSRGEDRTLLYQRSSAGLCVSPRQRQLPVESVVVQHCLAAAVHAQRKYMYPGDGRAVLLERRVILGL